MVIALLVLGALAAGAIAGVFGVLFWLRYTLLNGVAVVDAETTDPALLREIESLELDYAVAEELGYGGDALLGIESKLNAAKMRAAAGVNPEASLIWVVTAPVLPHLPFIPAESVFSCPLPHFVCSFIPGLPAHAHGETWIGYIDAGTPLVVAART